MKRPTPSAIKLRELAALAVFAALMIALKEALAFLPNVEVVTLLVILATVHMGPKALLAVAVFVAVQPLLYPADAFWIMAYCYVWPLLVGIVLLLRKWSHPLLWTVTAGFYGLLFGTLCSLPYFVAGGWGAGIGYIISGIPFDLLHCMGNTATVFLLFAPMDRVMKKILPH